MHELVARLIEYNAKIFTLLKKLKFTKKIKTPEKVFQNRCKLWCIVVLAKAKLKELKDGFQNPGNSKV